MKRVTIRIPDQIYSEVQAAIARRREREPKFSLNDYCIEALVPSRLTRLRADLIANGNRLLQCWSEVELNCSMDVLNGWGITIEVYGDYQAAAFLDIEFHDAFRLNQTDQKWSIDGPAFLAKLRDLPIQGRIALTDLAARFWAECNSGKTVLDFLAEQRRLGPASSDE